MSKSKRDELRRATLGAKVEFYSKIVEFNGQKFEIRQPSIGSRNELRNKCTKISDSGAMDFDLFEFLVWSVIDNTYVPDTDIRVFDDTDYDALIKNPTGGFMDQFSEVAAEVVNVDTSVKKKPSRKVQKSN